MRRHPISDTHEWINEIPTVPIYLDIALPERLHWSNQMDLDILPRAAVRRMTSVLTVQEVAIQLRTAQGRARERSVSIVTDLGRMTTTPPWIENALFIDMHWRGRYSGLTTQKTETKLVSRNEIYLRVENKREATKTIWNEVVRKWQERWNMSEKGRWTFSLIRKVKINANYHLDYYMTQILTGHGNFYKKLASIKLTDRETCECGDIDDAEHLLLNCLFNDDIRINHLTLAIEDNWKDNLN
ncbi:hypothetical protein J437_LFUL017453 [Ladona fulva]|uniref:Uncharacterized protein n=1 Tax=Ladona fulva TaxID=123851 RepID=A0A8K0KMB8_LADFU|nr:hypothetical protein J437_LFUL017453 [Ladona fulva]